MSRLGHSGASPCHRRALLAGVWHSALACWLLLIEVPCSRVAVLATWRVNGLPCGHEVLPFRQVLLMPQARALIT